MVKKKKIFPKLKKKLKGFLTDESGKISKKDALGLAVGAILLSGVESVEANTHANACATVTSSTVSAGLCANIGTITASHGSGIVNGHFSSPGTISGVPALGHSSHSNHGQGGWC